MKGTQTKHLHEINMLMEVIRTQPLKIIIRMFCPFWYKRVQTLLSLPMVYGILKNGYLKIFSMPSAQHYSKIVSRLSWCSNSKMHFSGGTVIVWASIWVFCFPFWYGLHGSSVQPTTCTVAATICSWRHPWPALSRWGRCGKSFCGEALSIRFWKGAVNLLRSSLWKLLL